MSLSNYIAVPPDSTGKKIRHNRSSDVLLNITNESIFLNLNIGDLIVGETSGAIGEFLSFTPTTSGTIIHISPSNDINFTQNENVLFNLSSFGTVISFLDIYQSSNVISDSLNPLNTLKIDDDGSSFVRFKDGNLLLDSFGNAQFSQTSILKSYLFTYESSSFDFTNYTSNGGQVLHEPENSIVKLVTNSSNGSSVKKISNLFFPYTPLQSNVISMAIACGDAGKEGVVRRWGLLDDDDGIYFELDGLDFSVNIKNSITSETTKVEQQNFTEITLKRVRKDRLTKRNTTKNPNNARKEPS
jgi:hypothetical protein